MSDFKVIGGVKFNESSVKSSEKVIRRGLEYNSVYLNDGTNILFRDQDPENDAEVRDYSAENRDSAEGKKKMNDIVENTMEKPARTPKNLNLTEGRIVFENINGGYIKGTYNEDDYVISGCQDMIIDVAQEDNKKDKVFLHDSGDTIFSQDNKHENKGNIIYTREEDKVTDGWFNMNDKNHHYNLKNND